MRAYFDALTAGDAHALAEMISASRFVKIGTDEGEIVEGAGKARDYYRAHADSTENFGIEFHRLDVQERGPVAWFFTLQTWRLEWRGAPEELPMRMTGVLEREAGAWKFVQVHASLGLRT